MTVTLTGMMGAGKSSVGLETAKRLGWDFIDVDAKIEERESRSVGNIFRSGGEKAFRLAELGTLTEIFSQETGKTQNRIIALGGGTLTTEACAGIVSANSFCIYLKATPATLCARLVRESKTISRPMLRTGMNGDFSRQGLESRLAALLSGREAAYERTASRVIVTDNLTIAEVADIITDIIASIMA